MRSAKPTWRAKACCKCVANWHDLQPKEDIVGSKGYVNWPDIALEDNCQAAATLQQSVHIRRSWLHDASHCAAASLAHIAARLMTVGARGLPE